jgi:hypothetical protein
MKINRESRIFAIIHAGVSRRRDFTPASLRGFLSTRSSGKKRMLKLPAAPLVRQKVFWSYAQNKLDNLKYKFIVLSISS